MGRMSKWIKWRTRRNLKHSAIFMQLQLNQENLEDTQKIDSQTVDEVVSAVESELDVGDVTVSVAFVEEAQIRGLNKEYRGKDKVTDVLSFPYPEGQMTQGGEVVGEVLVCYEQAKRQAREVDHPVGDEVVFLLVHGILHVFGYDHIEEDDRAVMFPLQEKVLEHLGIEAKL